MKDITVFLKKNRKQATIWSKTKTSCAYKKNLLNEKNTLYYNYKTSIRKSDFFLWSG